MNTRWTKDNVATLLLGIALGLFVGTFTGAISPFIPFIGSYVVGFGAMWHVTMNMPVPRR